MFYNAFIAKPFLLPLLENYDFQLNASLPSNQLWHLKLLYTMQSLSRLSPSNPDRPTLTKYPLFCLSFFASTRNTALSDIVYKLHKNMKSAIFDCKGIKWVRKRYTVLFLGCCLQYQGRVRNSPVNFMQFIHASKANGHIQAHEATFYPSAAAWTKTTQRQS